MRSRRWRSVEEVARTLAPATQWRSELAARLRQAADASFAAVVTCAPDDWSRMVHDADPPGLARVMNRLSTEYFPRIERSGEGWRHGLTRHGKLYAPLEAAQLTPDLAAEMRREVLEPEEIDGYVVSFLVVGTPPRLLGFTALGAPDSSAALLRRSTPLLELADAATATLHSALSLAQACGATVPLNLSRLDGLTDRERQIAALAAEGFSNMNVAARLGISPATVAVHLRHIYRKLHVHSRVELADALRR